MVSLIHANKSAGGNEGYGEIADSDRADTTTCSSYSLSETPELGNLAYCYDLLMTHILSPIFPRLVLTLYVATAYNIRALLTPGQKIRTIELDGKTVKLQIVSALAGMRDMGQVRVLI
jgi:hypothetical protein